MLIKTQPVVLIVLDGFGIGKDSPFNAIQNARMPFYRKLIQKYPHSQLLTHGSAVGLPEGVMGNSEVGHITMGAGRIVAQDLTRISNAIQNKEFFKNPVLRKTIEKGAKKTGRVHLMGLCSDGGVHSHLKHLFALLDLCLEMKVPHVSLHLFLDGRDTPPDSSITYLQELFTHPAFTSTSKTPLTQVSIATVMGRYWAMDRDKRWERIEKAYRTLTGQTLTGQIPIFPSHSLPKVGQQDILLAIQKSHENEKTDEFMEPVLLAPQSAMQDEDSVVFFNFRSDRARQITYALTEKNFPEFQRGYTFYPSAFAGMTQYDANFKNVSTAFPPQNLDHIFAEWLEMHQLKQLRIAETEKYAHVTFFFNGGREKPFLNEDRLLIPSPKEVSTYDLKPEMSAFAIAQETAHQIQAQKYDFIMLNFANADMVGHTGNYKAAVKSMEALDQCLAKVIEAAASHGYSVFITADHGNAEEMRDAHGRIHTQHTLNPVPAIWIPPGSANEHFHTRLLLKDGGLQDIMPTLCDLMHLPIPSEVTGKSLITHLPC